MINDEYLLQHFTWMEINVNKNLTTPIISKILQAAIQPEVFGYKIIGSAVKVQDKIIEII